MCGQMDDSLYPIKHKPPLRRAVPWALSIIHTFTVNCCS